MMRFLGLLLVLAFVAARADTRASWSVCQPLVVPGLGLYETLCVSLTWSAGWDRVAWSATLGEQPVLTQTINLTRATSAKLCQMLPLGSRVCVHLDEMRVNRSATPPFHGAMRVTARALGWTLLDMPLLCV
jgi:hypothetical protein